MNESIKFYMGTPGIDRIENKRTYSYIHYFADTRKLNIIYNIDSENVLESTLLAEYYRKEGEDSNRDFIDLVKDSLEPNAQYLRYWNGSMLFLRPLLTLLNMEQIYLLNKILLSILALILIVILFRKSKKLAIIFLLTLILVAVWYATYCIEYSVTFYIMIITSIIAISVDNSKKDNYIEEKSNDKLFKLFLITGITTCFFDFLTTEILTLFVPLIIILIIRKEENRLSNLKNIFKFVIISCVFWLIGYVGMWLAKWILTSFVLNINAFEYVKDDFMLRINGLQGLRSHEVLYNSVINRNLFSIPMMDFMDRNFYKPEVRILTIISIISILLLINWKEIKNKKFLLIFIFIGIMPYARYLILANHSFKHAMFTFRDQIITIMALLYIIIELLNYKLLFSKVSFKNITKNMIKIKKK